MKSIKVTNWTILFFLILIITACKKEIGRQFQTMTTNPPIVPQIPGSVVNYTNLIVTIELPLDTAFLRGSIFNANVLTTKFKWEQLSGPNGAFIVNPDSVNTKVGGLSLKTGSYMFKFTVTDTNGISSGNTFQINVQESTSSNKQVYFSNFKWGCPMGCYIEIENFFTYIPKNTPFSIYVQPDSYSSWDLATLSQPGVNSASAYVYEYYNGQSVMIYSSFLSPDNFDNGRVKIVF